MATMLFQSNEMATDPIIVGNVKWPNDFQNPTGIVAGAANPAMDPIALANSEIPADSAKPALRPDKTRYYSFHRFNEGSSHRHLRMIALKKSQKAIFND